MTSHYWTHLPLDKMASISQTTFLNAFFFCMRRIEVQFKFHWILFLGVQIENKWSLVQVMAWHRKGERATSHYLNQCWSNSPKPIRHVMTYCRSIYAVLKLRTTRRSVTQVVGENRWIWNICGSLDLVCFNLTPTVHYGAFEARYSGLCKILSISILNLPYISCNPP